MELSTAHKDEVQLEIVEDNSQDTIVIEDAAPQVIGLQQYQLDRDR